MSINPFGHKSMEFQTKNPHSEDFVQFENTRLMNRLQKKFTPKPYWKNYALLRGVVLGSSYLFNVLSAGTAAVLVYFFLRALVGSDMLAGVITAAALVALELVKRETGTRFFTDFLQFRKMSAGLAGIVLLMMGLSTTASYFGAKRAVKEFTPPPVTVRGDSLTAPLMAQVLAADEQIKAASQIKKKGVVTASAQRTIERLSRQKETALNEIARIQQRADGQNDSATLEHTAATKVNATGFAAITLTSELLLLLCLFYLQYYDYRSFVEVCKKEDESNQDAPQAPGIRIDTHTPATMNGKAVAQNFRADADKITHTTQNVHAHADAKRATQNEAPTIPLQTQLPDGQRLCDHCGTAYIYGHARQRFCKESCRVESWQNKNGKEIRHRINAK
jgi:hypothetical protein